MLVASKRREMWIGQVPQEATEGRRVGTRNGRPVARAQRRGVQTNILCLTDVTRHPGAGMVRAVGPEYDFHNGYVPPGLRTGAGLSAPRQWSHHNGLRPRRAWQDLVIRRAGPQIAKGIKPAVLLSLRASLQHLRNGRGLPGSKAVVGPVRTQTTKTFI